MRFDFGDFALDTDRRELTRGAQLISLGPKVFDLLVYLVENRDRVVSKDELLDTVWGGRIVSESTLTSHINAVRKAVGDTGAERNLVRTLARKGFRFVGEVTTGQPPADAKPMTAITGTTGEGDRQPAPPDKPSIAVLPFANMSSDPEQEYFSDGITEDLITNLSKISGLFVTARNSSYAYKGRAIDVRRVADELGVRFLLEGSVRKFVERVRITAQLIDPRTGYHLWAERYDRDMTDIFALQDEITEKIAGALEVTLNENEQEKITRRYTENLDAYDHFLRGREQFLATNETNALARGLFERAIELDPSFSAAYALLSYSHFRDWFNQWSEGPQALEWAFEAAQKAVALDDSLPLAHAYLAWMFVMKKQHDQAKAEARRAIAVDPNFAEGYARLGEILNLSGEPDEGAGLLEKAMRLEPHYPPHYILYFGNAHYALGNFDEAIAALKRCLTRAPSFLAPHRTLAVIYSELGRTEEARAEVLEMLKISPRASVSAQKERLPYKDQVVLARYLEGLRKAGLPD